MLAAHIAFVRNGACVLKDLLPGSHPVLAFKLPFPVLHYPQVPVVDLLIALLQLAAVGFGVLGGVVQIPKAMKKLRRASQWRAGLAELKDRKLLRRELNEAHRRLSHAWAQAFGSLIDGVANLVTGVCFYALYLGTLGWAEEINVIWAVVLMEGTLAILLVRIFLDISYRRSQAQTLVSVDVKSLKQPELASLLVDYVERRPLAFAWDNDLVPYHIQALSSDIYHLARAYEALDELASGKGRNNGLHVAELLDRAHKAGGKALSESWFDAMMALMDFVAWAGYLALPITYFYQDEAIYREYLSIYPGHAIVNWTGNLVGDVMWTVQPIVQLNSVAVLGYLQQPLRSGLKDKEL